MKKTWVFGIALALGAIGGPVVPASAQYSGAPYSSGALAPSGYAVPENYSAQRPNYQQVAGPAFGAGPVAQLPQYVQPQVAPSQFAQPQYAQPQYGQPQYAQPQYAQQQYAQPQHVQQQAQYGVAQPYSQAPTMTPATMVAYPQELIPAPGVNANQAPDAGWVGPNAGQYQAQGGSHSLLQAAPAVPMQQPGPVNGNMAAPYPQGNVVTQGPGCGDGGYGVSTYGTMLAPTATAPMVSGYAGGCGGGYAGGCGAPVYAGPVYASPVFPGAGFAAGFLGNRGSIPGRAIFAGGSALLFRRVDDHNVALSYDTAMPSENRLGTRDARQNHLNGFEVFGGRYFNGGRNAIMASYWGLFPEDQMARIDAPAAPSTYRSRYHFNGIDMPTQSVYDWYDGAMSHRIVRGSDYNNVEVNLLGFAVGGAARTWTSYGGGCGGLGARFGAAGYGMGAVGYGGGYGACGGGYDACGSASGSGYGASCGSCGPSYASCAPACGGDCTSCGAGCAAFTGPCGLTPNMCGSRLNWTWLAGFRWFQFADRLEYSASDLDTVYNGGADDLYYRNNVRNDLYGFQLGGAGTYCLGQRFNVYALSKAGIFNNHSTLNTRINRTGGPDATIVSTNVFNGDAYMVEASQNNAAVLGELGTGVGARITRGWSANVGYRVIGVSGVATAVNTIPIEMIHLGNVADYNTTSSLILHGVTVGGMYNF